MREIGHIESYIIQFRQKSNRYGGPIFARKVLASSFDEALLDKCYKEFPELHQFTWYDITNESGWRTTLAERRARR